MSRTASWLCVLSTVLVGGCGDTPTASPVGSRPTASIGVLPACQKADANYLQQQITQVFASSVRATARTLERQVEAQCASPTATEPTLTYVDSILQWRSRGLVADSSQAVWDYLSRLFVYNGYTLDNTIGALGKQGAIAICDDRVPNTANPRYACPIVRASAGTSGAAFFDGALFNQRYLVTIAPASCAPAGNATNLRVYGQCVEVSVDPKPTKSFTFAPGVRPAGIVQTCIAEGAPHYLLPTTASGARVARMAQKSATDPMVRVRDVAPQLFDPLLACDDAVVVASAPAAEGRWSGLTRVAAAARGALDLFAPRVAYAGHGGLGTLPAIIDDALSLFGPVDQYTFFGDFEQDVVGQPPAAPSDGSLRGRWTIATLNPGAVTVQPSLGDIASKLLVINQGGGNAQQKDGVEVTALLDPTPKPAPPYPFEGTYTVGLRAVVATPRAFAAPFILQSSTGAELARFTLTDGANAQRGPITFTAGGQSVTAGEWRQNVSQTIQFTVDFATGTVRLQAGSTTSTAALPFAATDLAQARWSITGRDGQIIGMDDLVFTRLVNVSRP